MSYTKYDKSNPIAPRTAEDFELRRTAALSFWFPHVIRPLHQEGGLRHSLFGVVEQSFVLQSTLDEALEVELWYAISESVATGPIIPLGTMPPGHNVRQQFWIMPEIGALTPQLDSIKVFEVPELRGPLPAVILRLRTTTPPTQGEITIYVTRRF